MPIPVGRSGNVDRPRRTTNCAVCGAEVVGSWWDRNLLCGDCMREFMDEDGLQPSGALRRSRTTRARGLVLQGDELLAALLEPQPEMDELPNDADSDGTDGS